MFSTLQNEQEFNEINIPILPVTLVTFACKSSVGPSYAANGPYTACLEPCKGALRNFQANWAMSRSITQCLGALHNVETTKAAQCLKSETINLYKLGWIAWSVWNLTTKQTMKAYKSPLREGPNFVTKTRGFVFQQLQIVLNWIMMVPVFILFDKIVNSK